MEQQPTPEAEIEKLRKRLKELEDENSLLKKRLNEARDPNPVKRPSRERVHRLLMDAGMYLCKSGKGWIVEFGKVKQYYRYLIHIWRIVVKESWYLDELFPSSKIGDDLPPPVTEITTEKNERRQGDVTEYCLSLDMKASTTSRFSKSCRDKRYPSFYEIERDNFRKNEEEPNPGGFYMEALL